MPAIKTLRGMFAFTILGATALVAYFQALGVNLLMKAWLTLPVWPLPPTALAPKALRPTALTPTAPPPQPPGAARQVPAPDAPKLLTLASVPECAGLELKIASQAVDPLASRVTVRHTGALRGRLLRRGSPFDDLHLLHVGYDAVGVTPVAWFLRGEALCQLRMFSRSGVQVESPAERARYTMEPGSLASHPEIHALGPGSFRVERAFVDRLLADPKAARDVQAAFERTPQGTFALEFRRVRVGGWAHAIGLLAGDRLLSVNDFELKNPRHALEAYGALQLTRDLVLKLDRSGKIETIRIAIR